MVAKVPTIAATDSIVEAVAARPLGSPPPLYGDHPSRFDYATERPWHRLAIMLCAEGHSYREIAERTGYTTWAVSNALRQPWARKILLEEIHRAGRDELAEILKSAATDSVFTLITLRDGAEQESVKLGAARELLDRFLGKANQPVTVKQATDVDPTKIDEELAALDTKERQLLGTRTAGADNAAIVEETKKE